MEFASPASFADVAALTVQGGFVGWDVGEGNRCQRRDMSEDYKALLERQRANPPYQDSMYPA